MLVAGVLAAVLLVLLNGCFAAYELAVVATAGPDGEPAPAHTRRTTTRRAPRSRQDLLGGARLGVTACSLGLGLLAGPLAVAAATWSTGTSDDGTGRAVALVVVLVVVISLQVVAGELLPKAVATTYPARVLAALGPPVRFAAAVVAPVVRLANAAGQAVVRAVVPPRAGEQGDASTREELRRLVRDSEASGSITHSDAELLDRTFRFAEKVAADVLTPRVEVEALPVDALVGDLLDRSATTGLSRFPVHRGDLDDVLGVVHVKDVLGLPAATRRDVPLSRLVREVAAVPESKDLESLMAELQAQTGQFAVVVDEYGGTAGIVTLEDVLEELVGNIDDEHDPLLGGSAVRRWAGAHDVSGRLHGDELSEVCGFVLPDGEYETLGGFVMDRLGRVPAVGDRFGHDGWSVEVLEVDGRRVRTVRLVAPPPGVLGDRS